MAAKKPRSEATAPARFDDSKQKSSNESVASNSTDRVKVKLQVQGAGLNKFFLVPEGKKFKCLLEKLSGLQEISTSGKAPRLSYKGIPLLDQDTPASKFMVQDAVIQLDLV